MYLFLAYEIGLNNEEKEEFKRQEIELLFARRIDRTRIARYLGVTRRRVEEQLMTNDIRRLGVNNNKKKYL